MGPSYLKVALLYRDDPAAFDRLLDRVLHGTAYRPPDWDGKVSMRFMPPSVNVKKEDAPKLVDWILSLDATGVHKYPKPPKGH